MCLDINTIVPSYRDISNCGQIRISLSGALHFSVLRMYEGSKSSHVMVKALVEAGTNCLHFFNIPIALVESVFRSAIAIIVAIMRIYINIPPNNSIDNGWRVSFAVFSTNIGRISMIGTIAITFFAGLVHLMMASGV